MARARIERRGEALTIYRLRLCSSREESQRRASPIFWESSSNSQMTGDIGAHSVTGSCQLWSSVQVGYEEKMRAPMRIAETKQQHVASGTNRLRNPAPKAPPSIAISLTSTIGPIARKASWAVGEKLVRETAMKASASEHRATMTASRLNTAAYTTTLIVKACIQAIGTQTLTVAAIAAPMTRKPQDWMKS